MNSMSYTYIIFNTSAHPECQQRLQIAKERKSQVFTEKYEDKNFTFHPKTIFLFQVNCNTVFSGDSELLEHIFKVTLKVTSCKYEE